MPKLILTIIRIAALLLLTTAAVLFLRLNAPIIKHDRLLGSSLILNLAAMGALMLLKKESSGFLLRILYLVLSLMTGIFTVLSVLNSVLIDYFQPLALYDHIIYISIAGLVLLILLNTGTAVYSLLTRKVRIGSFVSVILLFTLVLQLYCFAGLQKDFEFTNIEGEAEHIFEAGEKGYKTFRIPSLLVIPAGSVLENGDSVGSDMLIVTAEARRNSSLDDGEIDLVRKISSDGGESWSELDVVLKFESGSGKIGNATPVFDSETGEVVLLYISGAEPADYRTSMMISGDGGISWSSPEAVFDGIAGPGHGIQIQGGPHAGRLLVPAYHEGGSLSLYSDDHGRSWGRSDKLSDGNEAQIAQLDSAGGLIMIVRTNQPVSKPHGPLEKIYVTSNDGGESWSDFRTLDGIKEPVCMSSIVSLPSENGRQLYYSHPDDYHSRAKMTVAAAGDGWSGFDRRKLIYQGPSGYSELGASSRGSLYLVFENGAVEYDQRISFVGLSGF